MIFNQLQYDRRPLNRERILTLLLILFAFFVTARRRLTGDVIVLIVIDRRLVLGLAWNREGTVLWSWDIDNFFHSNNRNEKNFYRKHQLSRTNNYDYFDFFKTNDMLIPSNWWTMCCIHVVPHLGYVQMKTSSARGTIAFADLIEDSLLLLF